MALMLFILPLMGCEEVIDILDPASGTTAVNTTNMPGTEQPVETSTEGFGKKDALSEKIAKAGLNPDVKKGQSYSSKEDVGGYIARYHALPDNFVTKKAAKKAGWEGGSLDDYYPGCCIGGDYFGNYEGVLPKDTKYTECDIDTLGKKSRGSRRIIFSKDWKIYYTDDHYESFTLLYSE